MAELFPTRTRLALLEEVAERRVWRRGDGHSYETIGGTRVTDRIREVELAGWVELQSGLDRYGRAWQLTVAGRAVRAIRGLPAAGSASAGAALIGRNAVCVAAGENRIAPYQATAAAEIFAVQEPTPPEVPMSMYALQWPDGTVTWHPRHEFALVEAAAMGARDG